MNLADLFERFNREQRQEARLASFRGISTDDLKAAWDAFDGDDEKGMPGFFWPEERPQIEEVHRLLNERGEGDYCAV